jgi:hypothetical protein
MKTSVERILLGSTQLDRRVALATVKIGDVSISGVTVWRGGNGKLSVYWPRFWNGAGQSDVISVEPELRGDVEADVIAAYKQANAEAKSAVRKEGNDA